MNDSCYQSKNSNDSPKFMNNNFGFSGSGNTPNAYYSSSNAKPKSYKPAKNFGYGGNTYYNNKPWVNSCYGSRSVYSNLNSADFARSKSDPLNSDKKAETNANAETKIEVTSAGNNNNNDNKDSVNIPNKDNKDNNANSLKGSNLSSENLQKNQETFSRSANNVTAKKLSNPNITETNATPFKSNRPARPRAVISVFVLNSTGDKLLLTKRFNENFWSVLTEKLEFGEDFDDCAARIINDHTNIETTKDRIKFVCTYNVVDKLSNTHLIAIDYYLQISKEEEKSYMCIDPKNFESFVWSTFNEVVSKNENLYLVLQQFLKKFNIKKLEDIKNLVSN